VFFRVTGDEKLENVECGDDGCQTDGLENRECFPIFVPSNDPVFAGRKRCLMFVRSQEVPNDNCQPGFLTSHFCFFSVFFFCFFSYLLAACVFYGWPALLTFAFFGNLALLLLVL